MSANREKDPCPSDGVTRRKRSSAKALTRQTQHRALSIETKLDSSV